MSLNSPHTPLFRKRGGKLDVFNIRETLLRRRSLRKRQTEAESVLWKCLRNKRIRGLKFFRQYGIGHYIADFYCPTLKLAVEVDGDRHFSRDGVEYDKERSRYFFSVGVRTTRFSTSDVMDKTEVVLGNIDETCLMIGASPSLIKRGNGGVHGRA